ncbi:phosphomevalonate kinase [Streptomyces qinzhouensis]|uniref:phosphomevalonate kinase n=1 Tax=Streptomyces qinzhouensis TaxID=2599401 RepID=A0A5B8IQ03_9ACTN|nr:phosphomevalonate kinase [Streptomyces qinzhouensis]QDY75196.1 phosphomevalonate kinase [Streptomyces qinzhouensis]QDY80602.1 phosphomevalonate kinase [Streptomyces qinzhouensis]
MTAPRRTVVRHAPGKLFVAGEYAVVEPGNPAILVALDRHVTVTVTGTGTGGGGGAGVVISSDLGRRAVGRRGPHGRLVFDGEGEGRRARSALAHVVSAIETVDRLLAERGLPVPVLEVSVSSRLHEDGRKFGLGSSGAVTVATVAAVAAFCGLELTLGDRFRLALLATAELDPNGSGGDLAASTWGGWIEYRAPDRVFVLDLARRLGVDRAVHTPWPGHTVRRLPPPDGLSLEVGWTGNPASTASLVSALHRRTWRGTVSHRRFVETTADCVRAAAVALHAGDGRGLLHQVRRSRRELARLDDEVGLGIFTPGLTALCDAAEALGGAAKPSGAGGGDCGIALLDAGATRDITHLRQRWETAGVLPLPIRPALEGIEE